MKLHKEFQQGTPEWFAVRRLKFTASKATAIGNGGKGLETYVKELILAEIAPPDPYTNSDMDRGNLLEPVARTLYEFEYGVEVEEVAFVELDHSVGCSPDGFVGEDGLIEIKARNGIKHLDLLMGTPVDSGTVWQMQMQMLVTGRQWCDFISYNPKFKKSLYVKRHVRDTEKIEKLRLGIIKGKKLLQEALNHPAVIAEIANPRLIEVVL